MNKGAYILLVENGKDLTLRVGSLGEFRIPPGKYAYVGSALNGIESRVRRHFSSDKRMRWHIDYLLEHTTPLVAMILPTTTRLECFLNRLISELPDSRPAVMGFGCSDCGCPTHLHFLGPAALEILDRLFTPEMRIYR